MKRIAVFADGTWQKRKAHKDDDEETSVVKLYEAAHAFELASPSRQVCFYDKGVGATRNPIKRLWQGITGSGLEENIRQCYDFIREKYEPGDRVYLFGFSRGAYTVRSTIGMLRKVGLLKSNDRAAFHRAYRFYRSAVRPDSAEARAFRAEHSMRPAASERAVSVAGGGMALPRGPLTNVSGDDGHLIPVWFVGVWDTVGSYGIPGWQTSRILHSFHDRELSGIVRTARQALAIDERRSHFVPTLWEKADKPGQSVEQRWFAGTHSGVGGGDPPTGLADVALEWMRDEADAEGLLIDHQSLAQRLKADPLARLAKNGWFWHVLGRSRWRRMFEDRYLPQEVAPSARMRLDEPSARYHPRNLLEHLQREPPRSRWAWLLWWRRRRRPAPG